MQKFPILGLFLFSALLRAEEPYKYSEIDFEFALGQHDTETLKGYIHERALRIDSDEWNELLKRTASIGDTEAFEAAYFENIKQFAPGAAKQQLQWLKYSLKVGSVKVLRELLEKNPALLHAQIASPDSHGDDVLLEPAQILFSGFDLEGKSAHLSHGQEDCMLYLLSLDRELPKLQLQVDDYSADGSKKMDIDILSIIYLDLEADKVLKKVIELLPESLEKPLASGDFPLQYTLENRGSHFDLIKTMIEKNPKILNLKADDGVSVLEEAARSGSNEVFDYLLDKLPEQVKIPDSDNNYVLHAFLNCADSQRLLAGTKAVADAFTKRLLRLLEIFPAALKEKNSTGNFPLHLLAKLTRFHSPEVFQKFVELYPDAASVGTNDEETPLYLSAKSGNFEAFQIFYKQDPSLLRKATHHGDLPVYAAITSQNEKIFLFILDKDPSELKFIKGEGNTLLHEVAKSYDKPDNAIFAFIVEKDPQQLFAKNEKGLYPFQVATVHPPYFRITHLIAQKVGYPLVPNYEAYADLVLSQNVLFSFEEIKSDPDLYADLLAQADTLVDRLADAYLGSCANSPRGSDNFRYNLVEFLKLKPELVYRLKGMGLHGPLLKDFANIEQWSDREKTFFHGLYQVPEVWKLLKTQKEHLASLAKHQPQFPIFAYYPMPDREGQFDIEHSGAIYTLDYYIKYLPGGRLENMKNKDDNEADPNSYDSFNKQYWTDFFETLASSGTRKEVLDDPAWMPSELMNVLQNYLHLLNIASHLDEEKLTAYSVRENLLSYRKFIVELCSSYALRQKTTIGKDPSESSVLDVFAAQLESARPLKKAEVQAVMAVLQARPIFAGFKAADTQKEKETRNGLYAQAMFDGPSGLTNAGIINEVRHYSELRRKKAAAAPSPGDDDADN